MNESINQLSAGYLSQRANTSKHLNAPTHRQNHSKRILKSKTPFTFKSSWEPEYEDLGAGFVRLEKKQSDANLDDRRGTKEEALMSSLGCLELGGRMTAKWVRSTNFLQVFVTVEVKKQPLSKGCCCLGSAVNTREKGSSERVFLVQEETIQKLPFFQTRLFQWKILATFYCQCPFLSRDGEWV